MKRSLPLVKNNDRGLKCRIFRRMATTTTSRRKRCIGLITEGIVKFGGEVKNKRRVLKEALFTTGYAAVINFVPAGKAPDTHSRQGCLCFPFFAGFHLRQIVYKGLQQHFVLLHHIHELHPYFIVSAPRLVHHLARSDLSDEIDRVIAM